MMRVAAALPAFCLMFFWAWFGLTSFPWIVPADHNSLYVKAYDRAGLAGLGLAAVSAISIIAASGLFGRTIVGWILASILLAGLAIASVGLYPNLPSMQLSPLRLPAQILGGLVVIFGTAWFKSPLLSATGGAATQN